MKDYKEELLFVGSAFSSDINKEIKKILKYKLILKAPTIRPLKRKKPETANR